MKRKRGQSNLFDELQKTEVKLQNLDYAKIETQDDSLMESFKCEVDLQPVQYRLITNDFLINKIN